jgi:hypothetical protein
MSTVTEAQETAQAFLATHDEPGLRRDPTGWQAVADAASALYDALWPDFASADRNVRDLTGQLGQLGGLVFALLHAEPAPDAITAAHDPLAATRLATCKDQAQTLMVVARLAWSRVENTQIHDGSAWNWLITEPPAPSLPEESLPEDEPAEGDSLAAKSSGTPRIRATRIAGEFTNLAQPWVKTAPEAAPPARLAGVVEALAAVAEAEDDDDSATLAAILKRYGDQLAEGDRATLLAVTPWVATAIHDYCERDPLDQAVRKIRETEHRAVGAAA